MQLVWKFAAILIGLELAVAALFVWASGQPPDAFITGERAGPALAAAIAGVGLAFFCAYGLAKAAGDPKKGEQRRALEETVARLEASEALYKQLAETSHGIFFRRIYDRDGELLDTEYISPRAQEFFGCSAEELASPDRLVQLVLPEDLERHTPVYEAFRSGSDVDHLVRRIRRPIDGRVLWLQTTTHSQWRNGRRIVHIAHFDVSDLKSAEEDLKRNALELQKSIDDLEASQRLYRDLAEASPGVIVRYVFRLAADRRNETATLRPVHCDYASPKGADFFGCPQGRVRSLDMLTGLVVDAEIEQFDEQLRDLLLTGRAFEVQRRFRRPSDGEVFWVGSHFAATRTTDEEVIVHGVHLDVTDVKHVQLALERAYEQLELAVEQRTAELRAANIDLAETLDTLRSAQAALVESEKMASLGQLVAGVAHEINTPVGIGLTAISNLQDRTRKTRDAMAAGALRKADLEAHFDLVLETERILSANLERASRLISSFKQVAVDQTTAEIRVVDLRQYLLEVLESLAPELRKADAKTALQCPDRLRIKIAAGSLAQILTNLLTNAVIHGFADRRANAEIRIEAAVTSNRLRLSVADNGRGVSPEFRNRLFEPFFTTRRSGGGSGLGLHVVYNLVTQALGGTIRYEPGLGGGSVFTIDMPVTLASDGQLEPGYAAVSAPQSASSERRESAS